MGGVEETLQEKHVLSQHNLLNSIHVSLSGWFE